jgi:hypothetical protein
LCGISESLLTRLLFFIRVTENDDLAVVGWPKKTMVEVTKELSGEFLILLCIEESVFLLIRSQIHHRDPLRGFAQLKHR